MSVQINGTNGLTFNDGSSQQTAASGFGFKNRIINGDMRIDQRNAGASVTPTNGQYLVDRWFTALTQASKYTVQQNAGGLSGSNLPAGFVNYLGVTSSSAYSVSAGDIFALVQRIEANNVSDLAYGTSSAQTLTLSFKVYSSLTGTFGGSLLNSSATKCYVFSYSIPVANTWTTVNVTISGDTSASLASGTNTAFGVYFSLGMGSTYTTTAGSWVSGAYFAPTGSVNLVGTNGATFYITGVQLEKGSTATSFDYRPYGTELALCQRYYEVQYFNSAGQNFQAAASGSTYSYTWSFKVNKRAQPSVASIAGAWYGSTPTIYPSYDSAWAYNSSTFYLGSSPGTNTPAVKADAEL